MTLCRNSILRYRPLRAGTRVLNGTTEQPGTIGFFGKSADSRLWLVSCFHVLLRPPDWGGEPFHDGEPIYQVSVSQSNRIGTVDTSRASKELDCAAALLDPGIAAVPEVLGVGPIGSPAAAAVGMRVVKSACATGVTEGVVRRVQGTTVEIEPLQGFPNEYELSSRGDSGALWLDQKTGVAVALHHKGESGNDEFAVGIAIDAVLVALRLTLWTGA